MAGTLDNLIARVRATNYTDPNRLSNDLTAVLTALAAGVAFRRGIAGGVIAGPDGGTTLDVGDNAAARPSASLQPPQVGLPIQQGALAIRTQARAEMERRTLPGVVVSSTNHTDTVVLSVYVPRGITPQFTSDASTGQNTPSAVFADLNAISTSAKAGTLTAAQLAQVVSVTVPRPTAVSGHQPTYENGQVVDVTTLTQWDVRTHWVNHDGRHMAIPDRRQTSVSHALASPAPCCDTGGGGGPS